ncbi:sulfatase family protein [Botryobacter ruber]|uniref:sulfatase family protein n=1 Tax=Botryobacter ruber TaxID=2171629 RepID=UPI0013E29B9C|nr:sulfatase [Botryobacter ruber]
MKKRWNPLGTGKAEVEKYKVYGVFLLMALAIGITAWSNKLYRSQAVQAAKPNIVLFIGDDLGVTDTGPYGNKVVKTPNLDRFANESLLFTRTFAGSPTCGPSRSTLFTGLMPFRHGAHGNHSGVKDGTRSLIHYLKPLGYRVVIAGKYHIGPEEVFDFERVSGTNVPEPGHEQKPGLNYDLNMAPVDKWLARQQHDQPFLLIVADHSPHVIWPETSTYAPAEVDIPAIHIDTEDTRKSRVRYYEDITKMDGNVGKLLHSLEQHGLSGNTMVVFTADQGPQWPFAKWSLYDYGIRTPLLIRWPGQVKAGTRTNALVSQADLLPTFVEIAGGKAPGNIDGQSLLPVLQGKQDEHRKVVFASHTGDRHMNRSPSRMLRTSRYKYILNLAPENVYHTHMDKAKDHDGGREYWDSWVEKAKTDKQAAAILERYHHHPAEELYDLEADPHETQNLAANPKYAGMLKDFRKQLADWRQKQGDAETGPEEIPEAKAPVKGAKPVAPYVFLD